MIAVALMPLVRATTSAKRAGYRHPPSRSALAVSATMNGSPAHGSRITEMRPEYCRKYGESMKARAATVRAGARDCSVRLRYRTPAPAANRIEPSQSRWATQTGTPITEKNQ